MEQIIEQPTENIERFVFVKREGDKVYIWVSINHRAQYAIQSYVSGLQQKYPGKTVLEFVPLDDISQFRDDHGMNSALSEEEHVETQKKVLKYFKQAVALGASDLHLTIGRDNSEFTYVEVRVHGELQVVDCIDKVEGWSLAAAICQGMCDVTEKQFYPNRQQDARMKEEFLKPLGLFGARYSHTPSVGGLDAVMRLIPDDGDNVPTLDALGFLPAQIATIKRILRHPEGMVTLTGPTGSGKSTTLRAFSSYYLMMAGQGKGKLPRKRLLTIEDPPEGRIPGAIQTPIIADKKNAEEVSRAWLRAISSALRLDPDAILNGEIRDLDSAMAAINAAMTGHLLMTTLHTNDAISSIDRLETMGVPGRLIADPQLMIGLISQRLVPRLCHQCKIPYAKGVDELEDDIRVLIEQHCEVNNVYLRHREGCTECYKGHVGRTVVAEVIAPDARFFDIYSTRGKAAAKTYWHKQLNGITRNQHLLHYINAGEVDPATAHFICPIDEDTYTLIPDD
jgi:type II secretory ATPase GspE/PulE/Tfp pilus assembly ATPase PilB-like protein